MSRDERDEYLASVQENMTRDEWRAWLHEREQGTETGTKVAK